jgi:cell wall-associated NlpC family hydrolase
MVLSKVPEEMLNKSQYFPTKCELWAAIACWQRICYLCASFSTCLMHNILRNSWLLGVVALAVTSCSTQKKSTAAVSSGKATVSNRSSSGSPRFIEHISIKPADTSRTYTSHHQSYQTAGPGPSVNAAGNVEMSEPLQFKYSILLNVPVEEVTDGKLFGFIEDWYGTRYKYGGSDKSGVDCSAFAQTFISALYGFLLPRTSAQQYQQSKRIRRDELSEGDLVFFKTRGRKAGVSHVGVYIRNNKFVHASTSSGVMINDMDDLYYSAHYAGAGRVK